MLDVKFVRENLEQVKGEVAKRGGAIDFAPFVKADAERRALLVKAEELRHRRNQVSQEIASLKKDKKPFTHLTEEMRGVADEIKVLEGRVREHEEELTDFLLRVPNRVHPSVPLGEDPAENMEVRRWGELPSFSFEPRHHWEVGEALGILDFERAAKMTGARFVLYHGLGAQLERALTNFMMDLHTREHGYREVSPPALVNRTAMTGTGQLPKFEEDLFRLRDDDYFLIPTAEVPVTNIHQGEILSEEELPLSYVAATPCFRREAGSYGKDTRGLIRQHQFNKVELVCFTTPARSYEALEQLTSHAEEVLKRLGLHYRVVILCSGDMGFAAAKTYDLEVWLPGQGAYREISSCSNFEEFQARRCGIRYREKKTGKTAYVHTLNGSGLAVGRTVVATLENYQQADGSVVVPEALRPYMNGLERITRQ